VLAKQIKLVTNEQFPRQIQLSEDSELTKQESPADTVKPARRKSMQKLLQFIHSLKSGVCQL